ncbi:elongation factor P [Candidatus Curtissbacteria bacterium RIFCSPHIGHO2_12_FULL_38_9b]|uniref:Elongation factor P n=2 Tax=Candidatus Curtissiibacteriota TaxID=1752717 RepID=A0A1F5GYY9_9BACT|nr:MAG: elongation factor P [Candidatus Curtissbacteria bacterium RIFCSPLOWO2_01_FULL_37_9]OGD97081.1 MAG: elongation factor P [Candidatus Curtissbacteria bacterium RIFCSPHIGHO2_12_FULL_38_9b]
MISVTELRSGTVFEEDEMYFQVISYEHIKMGRGSGTVKVKVKNLQTNANIEKTFTTGAKVQQAELNRKNVQYLYNDKSGCHLMNMTTFEQMVVPISQIASIKKFLKEDMDVTLLTIEDKTVAVEIPKLCDYKIAQTGGSARGNTVGASYKDAVLENGLTVKVPLFIKTNEIIRVDTRSGDYVERAK